jgi:hypothetical protein
LALSEIGGQEEASLDNMLPPSGELRPLSDELLPLSDELLPLSDELLPLSDELLPLSAVLPAPPDVLPPHAAIANQGTRATTATLAAERHLVRTLDGDLGGSLLCMEKNEKCTATS